MAFRYYKRPWEESRGDEFDVWGSSIWFFEVDEAGTVMRQLERYAHRAVLKYCSEHFEDHYGGLSNYPLEHADFAPFEISKDEFEEAWAVPIIREDEPDDYNEVFAAIRSRDADGLRALIASGHDVNAPDPRPYVGDMTTPLHNAAGLENGVFVRILLDAGARVDARSVSGWTPLSIACNAGALEAAKLLVAAGADIDAKNGEGYSAYGRIPGTAPELRAFMRSKGAR